jgi:aspartate kinase
MFSEIGSPHSHSAERSPTHSAPFDSIVALKFGGTSLLGTGRMLEAARLVRETARNAVPIVVVSAMKGVTDRLLSIARSAHSRHRIPARVESEAILHLHLAVLEDFQLPEEKHLRVSRGLLSLGRDLLYEAASPERAGAIAEHCDRLASFGERFSARLFAAALEKSGVPAVPVSASDFVVTCDTFRNASPQLSETRRLGRAILLPLLKQRLVPVVTGFIGATRDGRITTLGRNSSDFSGALVAHVVDAAELVIWTDVDGIYTSNPAESAEARLLHDLSYDEAHALAAAGASVLHPSVLPLAAETETTIWIRNTFRPAARGTRIGPPASANEPSAPRGAE